MWEKFRKYHEKTTVTRVSLLKVLYSLTEGANMKKHLFEMEEMFDRLACAGQRVR